MQRGLLTVLGELDARWRTARDGLLEEAADRSREIRERARPSPPGRVPGPEVGFVAAERVHQAYDPVHHGFGRAPRFPTPQRLDGLLAHSVRSGDEAARDEALASLRAIAASALHDPLAGGFHRYAVDEAWQVPHYEKMTTDSVALLSTALAAWQVTGDPAFSELARRTLGWLDTMRSPGGGTATALDADSVGPDGRLTEGAYYTWTRAEVVEVLGAEGAAVADALGLGEERGAPRWVAPVDVASLARLRDARDARPAPLRDDTAITAVQGQLIGALARAGAGLGEPERAREAATLAALVLERARAPDGRLRRSLTPAAPAGMLEDQVLVADGMLALFEATADPRWLSAAVALMDVAEDRFADPVGGWFRAPDDGEDLLLRLRPDRDLPEPSGASVAVLVCLRLSALTGDARWLERADRALGSFAEPLRSRPTSLPVMVEALERRHAPPPEIVITWPPGTDPAPLLDVVRRAFVPGRVLVAGPAEALAAIEAQVPLARDKVAVGRPTAWVCQGGICRLPSTDPTALREAIAAVTGVTLRREAP